MSLLIVTDTATYEQRQAGTSNAGDPLTEVRKELPPVAGAEPGNRQYGTWKPLDPTGAQPVVGSRWLVQPQHGQGYFTGIVNEILEG
jgi:hypothetical protein